MLFENELKYVDKAEFGKQDKVPVLETMQLENRNGWFDPSAVLDQINVF